MGHKTSVERSDWHAKIAAQRIGTPLDEYLSRIAIGEKWCTSCKQWHSRTIFTIDRSRGDGLAASCGNYRPSRLPLTPEERRQRANASYRRYYASKGKPAIAARKAARKRNCDPVSPRHRKLVFEMFDGLCAYCGAEATTIDHVIPIKHGGGSYRGNLLPACLSCNSKKRNKSLEEFLEIAPNPSDRILEELSMEYIL